MNPTEQKALDLLEQCRDAAQRAINVANEFLQQLKVLGETKEERALTLAALEGLAPPELREAIIQYRERRALLAHLDKGAPPQGAQP